LRIGIDARPLKARSGGIRRYTEQLILALSRVDRHNEYRIFSPVARPDHVTVSENFAWEVRDAPLRSWFELLTPRTHVDLFHGLNYAAPLIGPTPSVLTIHDLTVQLFPQYHPRLRRLRHRLLPRMCRRASHLIADSQSTRDDLVGHFGLAPESIEVVHLAVDERFRPVTEHEERARVVARHELPDRFVLFVGSVEPRKNLSLLIRSMARVLRDDPKCQLVIVGEPAAGQSAELERVVASEGLELGGDVRLLGWVEDADLPALYSLCELFVYPSRYEGFGLPPLEAMACGAPVLVPDHSSFSELYRDCSLAVDLSAPDAEGALANTMQRVLGNNALRSQLVELGFSLAGSRSWDDVACETLEVYHAALARPGAVARLAASG